jgi:hypothetical protein
MTPAMEWHPGQPELQAYAAGRPEAVWDASVEAHLLACGSCRLVLHGAVPAPRLTAVFDAIEDRIDGLERPWIERLLRRFGLSEPDARALLAAPSLRVAWWGAVAASALLALLVAGQDGDARTVFLLLAPLLPAVSTAAAYASALDPAMPIVAATPYHSSRLLLTRSLAVGATSTVGACLAALAVPGSAATVVVWFLPALALTLLVLALSQWCGTGPAAAVVGGAWVSLVVTLHDVGRDPLATFDRTGQLISAGLAALALVVVVTRWQRLDEGGTT